MELEIRNNVLHISGYVNAVERESRRLPRTMCAKARSDFTEKICAGVFSRSMERLPEIRLMFNHARDIGGTADGTLKLTEDNIGLKAEAVISDSEVIAAAENGELRGWSFGFTDAVDNWEEAPGGLQRRTINDLTLHEVSLLSVEPAYIGTSVEIRCGEPENCEIRGNSAVEPLIGTEALKSKAERLRLELELLRLRA